MTNENNVQSEHRLNQTNRWWTIYKWYMSSLHERKTSAHKDKQEDRTSEWRRSLHRAGDTQKVHIMSETIFNNKMFDPASCSFIWWTAAVLQTSLSSSAVCEPLALCCGHFDPRGAEDVCGCFLFVVWKSKSRKRNTHKASVIYFMYLQQQSGRWE